MGPCRWNGQRNDTQNGSARWDINRKAPLQVYGNLAQRGLLNWIIRYFASLDFSLIFASLPFLSMEGECTGNILSTPTPKDIFRTIKVSRTPLPLRAITTPSKGWSRSLSPSTTLTYILTVSPILKAGTSLLKPSSTACI